MTALGFTLILLALAAVAVLLILNAGRRSARFPGEDDQDRCQEHGCGAPLEPLVRYYLRSTRKPGKTIEVVTYRCTNGHTWRSRTGRWAINFERRPGCDRLPAAATPASSADNLRNAIDAAASGTAAS